MRVLSFLRPVLFAAFALLLIPIAATPAQAATGTITGIAVDSNGKPLENVYWELYTLEGGEWTTLQFGPKLTDSAGRFSRQVQVGGQYRVCFSDSYYGESPSSGSVYWQPEVRHQDKCWTNANSWETAQTWTSTAAAPSKTVSVTLPTQGLGMAPVAPFILGSYQVGDPLTVVGQEGWRPTNTQFSYQWMSQSDGSPATAIPGATSATFVPTAAQSGNWVWAAVTASLPGYKPAKLTTPVSKVGTAHVQLTSPLVISGTATPGATLTASFGKPANTYSEIDWFVDGVPQPAYKSYDSASASFPVVAAHSGARVEARLKIYSRDDNGYIDGSDTFQRAAVQVSGSRPAQALPAAAAPAGLPTVGRILSAPAGVTADPNATLNYQWLRGATAIGGATTSRYTVQVADVSKTLKVRVTVSRPGWPTTYVSTSRATSVAKRTLTVGKLRAAGVARAGRLLTARTTGWRPTSVKFHYRWLRNGHPVGGATTARYKIRNADRGKVIKVRITATKPTYVSVIKTSIGRKVAR